MGLSSGKYDHARYRHEPYRRHDRGKAPQGLRNCRCRARANCLILGFLLWAGLWTAAKAEQLRIATFNTELVRRGPGLLFNDIRRGKDEQVASVTHAIVDVAADIVVLQSIDYDYDLRALTVLRNALANEGLQYPYMFARRPNTGWQIGLDMDGDGRVAHPRDAQGYGDFAGQGGMAILSRWPIDEVAVQDFSTVLWRNLPNAGIPKSGDAFFPSSDVYEHQRLSSVAHWVVPIVLPNTARLTLLTFHASPPVFDGEEDRNGRRNHDEIGFWRHYLDGAFGAAPADRFVLLGDFNLDPIVGDGRKQAIKAILGNPRLSDPFKALPRAERVTVNWQDIGLDKMRVSYVLPSRDLNSLDAGVHWPPQNGTNKSSRHGIVWVDLQLPR